MKDLAEQLGASKSTIQRDLATLEQEFALIEEEVGKQKKVYRIDQSIQALNSIRFGSTELLALHAASGALASIAGTPLHADLQAVIHKIRGFLGPRRNGGLDALSRVFHVHPRGYVDYSGHSEVIDDISDAIARRRVCHAVYRAAWQDTSKEHEFRPLRLVWHRSALYLLAQVAGKSDITTFAVHRIESLAVTDSKFVQPRVDVAEYTQRAFGIFVSGQEEDVEIIFSKEIGWLVEERVFHPNEQKERLADGRLRYRIRSSAQWEITPWVQTFGAFAELKTPTAWRLALAESARMVAELYDDD